MMMTVGIQLRKDILPVQATTVPIHILRVMEEVLQMQIVMSNAEVLMAGLTADTAITMMTVGIQIRTDILPVQVTIAPINNLPTTGEEVLQAWIAKNNAE